MDFRHQISSLDTLSTVACDALLVVVAGERADKSLDASLAAALTDAVAQGDLQLKAGKAVLLHRPTGVRAARVVFAAAGAASPKAIKAALAAGFGLLKGGGSKHVAVALAGAGELGAAQSEALVAVVGDASYVYRHTKPSAPAPGALAKVTLLCAKTEAK